MSTKTNFYLNGALARSIYNWQELAIQLNFDRTQAESKKQLSVTDFEFVIEDSHKILNHIAGGLNGGVGIFEAPTFRVEIERNGVIETPFDGYLDLTERPKLSCNRSTITSKAIKSFDWLEDKADSVTFEYLYRETNEITKNDFVFMPYVISSVPDYKETAIMLISVFVIGEQIRNAVQQIAALGISFTNPFEATAIVRAILYIVYIGILLVAIVKLIKDLIQMIIQPVKYHAGMRIRDSLRIGAAYFGLTFKSDIFDSNSPFYRAVIIPEKYNNPKSIGDDRILGFLIPDKNVQEGFYKGTFGDLLRDMMTMFNAKIILTDNNELFLVRQDYNVSQAQFQLPAIEESQPFYTYNAEELKSNYLIEFQTDSIEKNTIQEYKGTIFQVITQPTSYINKDLILMKNLESKNIRFALAKRKRELTLPEKVIKSFLDIFSKLINGLVKGINNLIRLYNRLVKRLNKILRALDVVNINISFEIKPIKQLQPVNFSATIENRLNMMKLETDFINVPKILLMDDGSEPKFNKLSADNETVLSAKYLWQNFHIASSFLPSANRPYGNQYLIKSFQKVPFCFHDYQKVKNNNMILDSEGNPAEIESLNWNIYNEHADMTIRFNKLYTNNLRTIELEPDGR